MNVPGGAGAMPARLPLVRVMIYLVGITGLALCIALLLAVVVAAAVGSVAAFWLFGILSATPV